jgi:two-component system LytT family response regulator
MNAIIIDDELAGISILATLLQRHCPQVNVVATCSNPLDAKKIIQELSPDLVFLDIQMPAKSGLEMLSELTEKTFEVIIVTAHSEYMLQALQFSAVDYLLKPVDEDKLIEAVKRVTDRRLQGRSVKQPDVLAHNLRHAASPGDMRLCIPMLKGFVVVKLEDIVYCEAEGSYTVLHFNDKKAITVSKPLGDYDQLLEDGHFLRVHKSYLINLQHVKEYHRGEGGMVIMSNDTKIEVSRRRKDVFLEKIKDVCIY